MNPAGDIILKAERLTKRFGGFAAVSNVDLAVERGTIHALIGPNGAGKTTAFNLISGMFAPDSGRITLDGRSIAGLEPHAVTEAGLGRSFQITNLFGGLSVQENIRLAVQARHPARFHPFRDARAVPEINADTAELLRWTGLAGAERAEAASLSYGGQRLLDMGLALATRPRVLLLDEPLAGLAAAERERVCALVKKVAAGVPVLIVEHDIDRVLGFSDRVTVMNEGRVLMTGSPAEVRADRRVQEVYTGTGVPPLAGMERKAAADEKPLLAFRKVNAFYDKSHILDDASLDVRRNEIVALLGRNGAGKSTLIRLLSGAELPTSGHIRREMSVSWPLAFTGAFQPNLTGIDNLKFVCRVYGVEWKPLVPFVEEFTELGLYLREPVFHYSSGMIMRLAFALSMAIEFDCFLIDEGLAVGDARFGHRCHVELFQKRKDRAFILVSHDPNIVRQYCERACVLHQGHLQEFDSVQEAYDFYESAAVPPPTVEFD